MATIRRSICDNYFFDIIVENPLDNFRNLTENPLENSHCALASIYPFKISAIMKTSVYYRSTTNTILHLATYR